ncbi:peptidase A2 domain-containing protein [Trichonephila clavipes]|nr:peptidase A2 domain-containing protein [Trichonephila clavipes]
MAAAAFLHYENRPIWAGFDAESQGQTNHATHPLIYRRKELGFRKPSELLRNMKRRAESLNVDDKLMMELFLQHLPSSVQTILAAVSDLTLNQAANIVDRIIEFSPSPIETFAVSNKKSKPQNLNCFVK